MHNYRRLEAWQGSMDLAVHIYRATEGFPTVERFGLASQMRRAVTSVSFNIAEGAGRGGEADMARFLRIALGSLAEVECQMEMARRLGYLGADPTVDASIKSIRGKIKRLHNRLLGIED